MGKPVKITDKGKSWNKSGRNASDKFASKKLRKRILIVCEGEKTEPNYFRSIKKALPPGVATVDVFGLGMNTLSLVDGAKNRRDQASVPYDEVWVVFDRDSFEPSDFDNAIHKAKSARMNAAWSNEAFELWYLLHFKDWKTAISRTRFQEELSTCMNKPYRKNDTAMFETLQRDGDLKSACKRAKDLRNFYSATPPNQSNPCTHVDKLVVKLISYCED